MKWNYVPLLTLAALSFVAMVYALFLVFGGRRAFWDRDAPETEGD